MATTEAVARMRWNDGKWMGGIISKMAEFMYPDQSEFWLFQRMQVHGSLGREAMEFEVEGR